MCINKVVLNTKIPRVSISTTYAETPKYIIFDFTMNYSYVYIVMLRTKTFVFTTEVAAL